MDIDGDIKVWTDGEKACARLQADGPEGPIVVQASAPLGPSRRRLMRAMARRGVTVSGDDPSIKATLERTARKKVMRRLRKMAPAAFARGGLASYVAKRELFKRRRQRKALARAGQPVGVKAIGPVVTPRPVPPPPPPPKGKQRRRPRLARWTRPLAPAVRPPVRPALAPIMTAPASASPGGGGGGGTRPALGPASTAAPSTPAARDDAALEEDQDAGAGEDTEEVDDEADAGEGEAEGDAEAEEGEDDGGEDEGDEEDVGAESAPTVRRHHVHQAMALLNTAQRHPGARRRVRRIVHLAQIGDPVAKKALKALKVAKGLKKPAKARPALPAAKSAKPQTALTTTSSPTATPSTPPRTSALRRWLDVFAAWRQGIG